jgi:hypothetical protein
VKIQWENLTVLSLVSTVNHFDFILHFIALKGHSDITVSLTVSLCNFSGKGQYCNTDWIIGTSCCNFFVLFFTISDPYSCIIHPQSVINCTLLQSTVIREFSRSGRRDRWPLHKLRLHRFGPEAVSTNQEAMHIGVQLGLFSTEATNGLGDYDDGEIGGMIGRGNRSTWKKPAPVPLCPLQTPHAAQTQTRAAAVGSQHLTVWAMAWPTMYIALYLQYHPQ